MHRLTWAEYAREHAPVHDSILSGRDAHEGPFMEGGWPCVLLVGGLSMDEECFSALAGAAGAQGDTRFVVTYRATVFEQDPPVEAWRAWKTVRRVCAATSTRPPATA